MKRVVITGMSINTPIGDSLDIFFGKLISGQSAITRWQTMDTSAIFSKIGGDLSKYDFKSKHMAFEGEIPEKIYLKLKKILNIAPWSTKISAFLGIDAWRDAGLFEIPADPWKSAVIVAGHNINMNYLFKNYRSFEEDSNYIDPLFSLHSLDTDHAATVSELVQAQGGVYTVGGACASGNLALKNAINEIRFHGLERVLVLGAAYDYAPADLQGMCLMGALSFQSFNECPERASRPFDQKREGFVPSHGGGALILESLDSALARNAKIYTEVIGVESNSDANRLTHPSEEGQVALFKKLFKTTGIHPEEVNFVSAHATSTQIGDLVEIRSIKKVFGSHVSNIKINAPKSILGHTCWSSAVVELIAAILQANAGKLHPTINVESIDPEVDIDICANNSCDMKVDYFMKNSFGFGGINSASILRKYS